MTIFNFYSVTDRIASSGQPSKEEFQVIAEGEYELVINLAMPNHEKSISEEGCIVTSLGMSYIHIPVPFDSPNEDHYREFCSYMDALQHKKVWVHCIVNARVSAFLFRYLQEYRGLSPAEATTPILEQWLPNMDEVWKGFIERAPNQL
ncbi:protein tyrosine phosphatase family protein [Pseudoteredinibacter isoporae]|uniref:Protein tyrosine phosphatase (PTP) superfamily phosphohydrolase (DUF442 family) n=1 Tax=Pseudoteredinibacter isoporae TaxID=570281 RepID=A0A7X0JSC8_9GAMM|nr:protein tyrosine phosphatase family protein [Pseudoteredinibacter isoporae]MBB6521412.1 protein tyrosine phosphatase (PTP) superfamily phosphohydrolase (DUF442 family) [Pseudoteredinibacter isoporae]NHO86967.1 phosphatase [Pseudoteredinibacter isoporae]NIB24580.1 phosphatase [Pseudoteredinibacter isoporae]